MHDNQGKLQEGKKKSFKKKNCLLRAFKHFINNKTISRFSSKGDTSRHGIEHANIHRCTAYHRTEYTQELRKWLKFPDCYPDSYTSYIRNITMAKS